MSNLVLIKNAYVLEDSSPYHQQKVDVLIVDGRIEEISRQINHPEAKKIEGEGLHLSAGWVDMNVSLCDPGYEHKESLATLLKAAVAGGFTQIATLPNTLPIIQNKEAIAYLKKGNSITGILPMAAITKDCQGKEFTEMLDLHHAGAVAFTDGEETLWNADILLKTLLYLSPINGLLMNKAQDPTLAAFGQMHEGITSTSMGMKGIPSIAEELAIQRDLKLLEYADLNSSKSVLHFMTISTEEGVEAIRKAKQKGLPISCDVAAHQLAFIDEDLQNFDTNLKVSPPFRTKADQKALQEGLLDGTIDAIVSAHSPQDEESKVVEFDKAEAGIIGIQTAFAVANTYANLPLEMLIKKLTSSPRELLRQRQIRIKKGEIANITLFEPHTTWVFDAQNNCSTTQNSPFLGKEMKGKVVAVYHNAQLYMP